MKRYTIYIFFFLFLVPLMSDTVYAACSKQTVSELFQQLQSTIPWVDITIQPAILSSACRLTIRYYPCGIPIEVLLITAAHNIKSRCLLLTGFRTHIEGYCALQNVQLDCL